MNISNFFNDINLKREDTVYLVLLLAFGIYLSVNLIHFNQSRGVFNSDIYIYLMNSLTYAGLNVNHIGSASSMFLSPVICFLTSLIFRLGYVDLNAIFIVTGFFSILGILGMYAFLKIRFTPLLSFTGSLIYSSLSITLYWFANGMLDVPAVSMILWTLVFAVAAIDRNPKYYIMTCLMFVVAFFIRPTTGFVLFIGLLYFFNKYDVFNGLDCLISDRVLLREKITCFIKEDEFKWICVSVLLGLGLILAIFFAIRYFGAQLAFFNQAYTSMNGFKDVMYDPNHFSDKWFYIRNFLNFLSSNQITFNDRLVESFKNPSFYSYLLVLVLISGMVLKLVNIIKNKQIVKSVHLKNDYKTRNMKIYLPVLFILLVFTTILAFKVNYLISIAASFLAFCILLSVFKKYDLNNDLFAFSIINLALIVFYMIIFSYIEIKSIRYILPVIPGFVYFIVYSLSYILNVLDKGLSEKTVFLNSSSKVKSRRIITKLIPIILIIACLFMAFNFTDTVEIPDKGNDILLVCDFIKNYDSDYQSKDIGSYIERYYEWYLNKDVMQYSHGRYKDNVNFTYIIYQQELPYDKYHEIFKSGDIRVYERAVPLE